MMKLTVYDSFQREIPTPSTGETILSRADLISLARRGEIIKNLFKFHDATFITGNLEELFKPCMISFLLRLLSRGACALEDLHGNRQSITTGYLVKVFADAGRENLKKNHILAATRRNVESLIKEIEAKPQKKELIIANSSIYLRSDPWKFLAGGSVGHIAGVLNNLDNHTGTPIFFSANTLRTVREDIETCCIPPETLFLDLNNHIELATLHFNEIFRKKIEERLQDTPISLVYQRYGLNNFTGVEISRKREVPFILEYNGSEIWMNRNWGSPLKYEELSEKIEMLNLRAADLIVVVSRPMQDELTARGISKEKILVNPNGVNTDIYHPAVDGAGIREKYEITEKTVIGFIGTFGHWHGAEVLTDAFGRMINEFPAYRDTVRLLLVGDGARMPEVRKFIREHRIEDLVILTGIVPQEQGPSHLAACDILASPHVPNPDGTPFFGSPTKLFEYMAMGRGIVASDLDQVGEVLTHNETAWMVKPGDVDSLADGLKTLIEDKTLREKLGRTARKAAEEKHTWRKHTERIISCLTGF